MSTTRSILNADLLIIGAVVVVVALLVLPIPPLLLDLLITVSIASSLVVLLVALQTSNPLDLSTFPTLHGERAVVRLFGTSSHYQYLDDLGLHEDLRGPLRRLLGSHAGDCGVYLHITIPGESEWTVIFNKVADQWGAFSYDPSQDALRVAAQPQAAEHVESMEFVLEGSSVVLRWEKLAVGFEVGPAP